jgi:hypothetical protein
MVNPSMEGAPRKASKKRKILVIVIVLIIIIIAVGCVLYRPKAGQAGYQAVFISNGQVYFGKITRISRQYAELTDIYYLQLTKPLQAQEPPAAGEQPAEAQPKLTLIKLGNELHGPVDAMKINRDHILFIENLKADGKVAQAIAEYQKTQAEKK